jgi:membrane protein implicated in regulation of membrane protease activity
MGASDRGRRRLAAEAAAFGVGYASLLCWASTALVGSFGGAPLASPYWPDLPWLRTDTTGVVAFALAAVSFMVSRYLRLRRSSGAAPWRQTTDRRAVVVAAQATAETAALLTTAIFVYLSINAVTHYDTMRIHLTHLLSWPSEGTVRVIALGICAAAVAATRYLRSAGRDGQREILGDGRVGQVEQPAASPDLETGLSGRVDPG